jgi:drug/metabolite transporter (DMT)-like permease
MPQKPGVADHAAPKEPSNVKVYGKFVAQVAVTVIAAVVALLNGSPHPGASDWVNVAIIGLGAVAVLGAGNLPSGVWAYAKGIVAAATAVAVLLQSVITDGISSAEWLQLLLAALGALGVYAAPGPKVFDAAALGRATAGLRPGPQV